MEREERKYPTVSRVAERIKKLLEPATSAGEFWVQGELSSVSKRSNGLWCDLVETRDGTVVAKLHCVVWPRWIPRIEKKLEASGAGRMLRDGVEVGLACQVSFSPVYGLSLWASDIDPEVSLGALEARRRRILAALEREGLVGLNARRARPALPRRVGLVASRGTAGYEDFVRTIAQSGYGVLVLAADARVQGDETEASVLAALDCLARLGVDLVVVVRGGGSKLDLSHLDNEAIARRIAAYPVVVWTGIGHETDECVLDRVAARAFKTPTAAAEGVVELFRVAEEGVRAARLRLATAVERRTAPEARGLVEARRRLVRGPRQSLREEKLRAATRADRLRCAVGARLGRERGVVAAGRRVVHASSRLRVTAARADLTRLGGALRHGAGSRVGRLGERVASCKSRLRRERFLRVIEAARHQAHGFGAHLRAADPARVLARGFAIVEGEDGRLVRSVRDLSPGARTLTRLADGVVRSVVSTIEERTDE